MAETGQALADALPNGQHRMLEGQQHNVAPDVLAAAMKQFFQG